MGPEDYEDSSLEEQVVEAPSLTPYGTPPPSSAEDRRDAEAAGAKSWQREHSPFRFNKQAFLLTAGAVVGVLLVVGLGTWLLGRSSKDPGNKAQSSYASQSINTEAAKGYSQLLTGNASLQVNGILQVSKGVTLQPSGAPSNPKTGQLYYDAKTNQPYYYNGSKFISFAPKNLPAFVSSLGGISGDITVGSGLQVTSTGQLSLSSALLQSIGTSDGTVQWTDLTNYPAACAAGQALTRLEDSPTCSPFLTSSAANASYIKLQSTTPGTAQTGSLRITGTGIAGALQAGIINATTTFQANGTPGVAITCSSGEVLQDQVVRGGIVTGGSCASTGSNGAAGGDLSGNYPNPTVAKIQGTALNITGPTSGQILIWNGSGWTNATVTGDVAISSTGVTTISNNTITSSKIVDGTITGSDIANATITGVNVVNDTITLGVKTAGNYQSFTTAGDGISVTGAAGEGTSPTVAVDSTVCRTTGNCGYGGAGSGAGVASVNTLAGDLTVQGTAGKIAVSDNGTNTITLDLDASVSLLGQTIEAGEITDGTIVNADLQTGSFTNITGLGTIVAGTWNATSLTDSYVDNGLTIDATGTVNWQALSNYPAACSAGEAITALADSPTCSPFLTGAAANGAYVQLQATTPGAAQTGNLNISGTAIAGFFTGDGSGLTNLDAGNIATGVLGNARLNSVVSLLGQSIALGTETTGNYQTFTAAGDGISVTGAAGNGTTPTIAVDGTVCRTTGNCAGAGNGGGATNSGSQNYITKTDASGNLINSQLYDDGTGVGLGTTTPGYLFDVQGGTGVVAQFSGRVIGGDAVSSNEFVTKSQLDAAVISAGASGVTSLNSLTGGLTVQGTAGKVAVSDNATDTITLDLDASVSLLGQTIESGEITDGTIVNADLQAGSFGNITGVGVLTVGTWNATSLADAYIDNNITIDATGTVNWQALSNYPAACAAGKAITALGDSVTCSDFLTGAAADAAYIQLQTSTPGVAQTGNLNISGTAIAGFFTGDGSGLTNLNATNIATGTVDNARLDSSVSLLGQSIALGSETTGNYQLFTTQGDGITVTGAAGVGASPTVAVDGTVCRTTGNCGYTGSGTGAGVASLNTLAGDLTVQGTAGKVVVSDNTTDTITLDLDASVSLLGQSIDSGEIVDGTITNIDLQAGSFTNITGVGILAAGSINWTGNVATTGTVSGATINGTTINQNGNQVCDISGNCGYTGSGTGAGVASLNGLAGDLTIQGNSQIAVNALSPNISLSIQADSIGDAQLAYNTGQNLTISSTPTFDGLFIGGGDVGIGTLTPSYRLDVAGTANAITLFQNGNQVCDSSGNCAGAGNGGGVTNAGQQNFLTKTDANGNLVSSQIYDDGTKISIGSTSPGYDLQVDGTVQATTFYQGANQVCDVSGNCGYNGAGTGAGVGSVNTLTGDLTIQGNSQILVNNLDSTTIGLSIQADTIGDAQLQYDTGQNLTVTSTPTFAGLTLNGTLTVNGVATFNENLVVATGKTITLTGGTTATRNALPTTEGSLFYDTSTHQLMVYNGSKWKADGSEAVLVAANNSSDADKAAADYLADGTDDQTEINSALTAASSSGTRKTGKVYLFAGTYSISAAISVPNSTTLAGSGAGTLISIPNTQNGSYYAITNTDTLTGTRVTIQDIRLDGNKINQTSGVMYGIRFTNMGSGTGASARQGAKIINVRVNNLYGSTGAAIYFGSSSNNTVSDTVVQGNDGDGIFFTASSNNTISSNNAQGNGGAGIYLSSSSNNNTITGNTSQGNNYGVVLNSSSNNTITGNTAQGNTSYGINVNSSSNNTITGNTASANSAGIFFTASSNSTISSNVVSANTTSGIYLFTSSSNTVTGNAVGDSGGATDNNGIRLSSADSNIITNNSITDSSATTTNYAINIFDSTSDTNYLSDNSLGGGSINDVGTGTVYGGQVNSSGNFVIQPAGTVELMKNTNITGTLNISSNVDTNGSLTVGNANQFVVSNLGVVTSGTWQGSAVGLAYGGTNNNSYTTNGVVYSNGSALVSTAAGTNGQCLLATTGSAPSWGACTTSDLQGTYNNSSPASILLTNAKDLTITAADTATDSNILFNLQCTTSCGSNGRFAVQSAGSDVFKVSPNGDIVIGTATNNITLTASGSYEPVLVGGAKHSKTIKLNAEYVGATLDAAADTSCASANSGTMTSGYTTSGVSSLPENYYNWTSAQATAQCYDIVAQVVLPSDFDSWTNSGTNSGSIDVYSTNTTNGTLALDIRDTSGTVDGSAFGTSLTPASASTWTNKTFSFANAYTYSGAAGKTITLRIRMSALSNANVRIGAITLNYKSHY